MKDKVACRMAKRVLHITDPAGNAVKDTGLQLEQTAHAFLFGCGAFDSIPYTNGGENRSFFEDRVNKWMALFNYGTMPFYWGRYEPEEGKPAFTSHMNASRFLVEHGKKIKGHPLCWHTV